MIKKIYCLGSSHTAGGGFHVQEGQEVLDQEKLNEFYSHLVDNPNMSTLSWPGLLDSFLDGNIEVINLGLSGSGNERMYRLFGDIISKKDFNKQECLFIFEPTYTNRKEYWSNSVDDYIVLNYTTSNPKAKIELVHEHYRGITVNNVNIGKKEDLYQNFISETTSWNDVISKIEWNYIHFYNFVKSVGINHLIMNTLFIEPDKYRKWYRGQNTLEYKLFGKTITDLWQSCGNESLYIKHETVNHIDDFHQGYFVNNIISKTIYNSLISNNFIDTLPLKIENTRTDWLEFQSKMQKIVDNKKSII